MTEAMTPCGPLCDRDHKVTEPHNRNNAPADPQDKQKKKKGNGQKVEADPTKPITFEWDGEEWTFVPEDGESLEFLADLEDADSGTDPGAMIRAMRRLLGGEQAARLFKGRKAEDIIPFFEAATEAAGSGNR